MIKASEYAECSYCIGRFAAGLVTPDQFKTGERIALDIVLPKLDNELSPNFGDGRGQAAAA